MATAMKPPTAEKGVIEIDVDEAGLRQVRRWGFMITIGSFLFGYDTGVISGALIFIRDDFDLNSFEQSSVVSVLLFGAMVGALYAGRAADRVGRRTALFGLAIVFLVGIAGAALANGYWMLVVSRIVMGVGVGGVSAIVPPYLSEVSPAQVRGRMLTLNQLLITIGMLCAYLVNLVLASSEAWRAMFWVGAVPSALLAVVSLRLPESPAYLIASGRTAEAKEMISSVAGPSGADKVVERYRREDAAQRAAERAEGTARREGWSVLLARHVRPAAIVGLTLAALQQFGGVNTILYYAPTIMQQTGLNASNSILYAVAIGVINLSMTIVSIRLIDRVGRRLLLRVSLAGMAVSLALLGMAFVADLASLVALVFMLTYIMSFAVGMGPVFWVLLGELFPSHAKAEGSSAGSTVNWLSNFLVSLAFLPLVEAIGQGETFWVFAVVCVAGFAFVSRRVPETRNRDYSQINDDLQNRWPTSPADPQ